MEGRAGRIGRALGLACALLLACSGEGSSGATSSGATDMDPAAPFDLERLDAAGGRISLAQLEGSWVLVDFWATWCPPCVLEIPELNAVFAERPEGVELLAISVDTTDPAEVRTWVREQGMTYPVALGDEELARLYGATSFPLHLLISPDGRVVERLSPGFHDRAELLEFVARHAGG
jgi:thiol-disulfide isomerase/thioredoxin